MSDAGRKIAGWSGRIEPIRHQGEPLAAPIEFPVHKIAPKDGGGLDVVEVRQIVVIPTTKSRRPARLAKQTLRGEALLDSFFEGDGGEAFQTASDEQVWEAALQYVESHNTSRAGRWMSFLGTLNVTINLALLARAGVTDVEPWAIPTH